MYSPQPPRDGGWWEVRGVAVRGVAVRGASTLLPARPTSTHPSRDGEAARAEVDVLRGLRTGVWEQAVL